MLLVETKDSVATLTLNRPDKLNAFNRELSRELVAALGALAKDDAVRAIILTGSGRAFCAGQDLAEAIPQGDADPDLGAIVKAVYTPVIRVCLTIEKAVGANNVVEMDLNMGAEDFSFYAREVPGFFFFVGATPKGQDPLKAPSNHSPEFFLDEDALKVGTRAMLQVLLDYQQLAE